MATATLQLGVDDKVTYKLPREGQAPYLYIYVNGKFAHQLRLPIDAARRLRDTLTAGIAALEEREAATRAGGAVTDQTVI